MNSPRATFDARRDRRSWLQRAAAGAIASRVLLTVAVSVAGAAMLAACASKPPPPSTLSIKVSAGAKLNADNRGRPSPVVVRLYELKSVAEFNSADFLSLYEKDQQVLGAALVVRDELVVNPGESKTIDKLLDADARFIGVMASFRELEKARWRSAVTLVPAKNNVVTITLDALSVQAAGSAQ